MVSRISNSAGVHGHIGSSASIAFARMSACNDAYLVTCRENVTVAPKTVTCKGSYMSVLRSHFIAAAQKSQLVHMFDKPWRRNI